MKRIRLLSLLVMLGYSAWVFADFGAGLRAFDNQHYTEAYKHWLPLAQAGNTDAQNNLGWMFENGLGMTADHERALYWYDQAAATSPVARQNFERLRATVPQRPSDAETKTPAPATTHFDEGLKAYDLGEFERAYTLWLPLAESGHADAQNNLGWMFEHGEGIEQDLTRALGWYERAAADNEKFSEGLQRVRAAMAAAKRDTTPKTTPTPTPLPRSQQARFTLGLEAYDRGDYQNARELWLPLAKQNHGDAANNLGWLYEHGQGVQIDYAQALTWYQRAAIIDPKWQTNVDRVTPLAQKTNVALARTIDKATESTLTGEKIRTLFQRASDAMSRQQYKDAFDVFSLLAENGHAKSQTNLGYLYANGFGTDVNLEQAQVWYEQAAKQGEPYAQNNLGALVASGDLGKPNYVEAYKWFSLAEANGHTDAANNKRALEDYMTPGELKKAAAKVQSIKAAQ